MGIFHHIASWKNTLAKVDFARENQRRATDRRNHRRLGAEALECRHLLTTVTTNLDVVDENDGLVSIREAIEDTVSGGTVDFLPSLNGATIALDDTGGEIQIIGKSLTITAAGLSNGITIDASSADSTPGVFDGQGTRIFNIVDNGTTPTVTLIGLTLTGADSGAAGGAIRSQAELTVRDSIISGNAAYSGGAIYQKMAGTGGGTREVLRIDDSLIEDNHSTRDGGVPPTSGESYTKLVMRPRVEARIADPVWIAQLAA